jgi:protein-tyrosine phosphatase
MNEKAAMNTVTLEGSPNFRDLGGNRTTDGQVVRRGLLFRSGHLAQLTDSDLVTLGRLRITTVVDFRPDHEIEMFGADRIDGAIPRVSIPIGDHPDTPAFYESIKAGDFTTLHDLADASRTMIRENAAQFAELLHLLIESNNLPLIFHCIGGKDRTGVATALILSLLGVPWETVRSDYLQSNTATHGVLEKQISRLSNGTIPVGASTEENIAALRRFFVLDGAYIDAALTEIELLAGSVGNYASQWLDLSPKDIASLRRNLLIQPTLE